MEKRVRWPSDFTVEQCITKVYLLNGNWTWHCDYCKLGAKRHLSSKTDAALASDMHSKSKQASRQHQAWKAWWYAEIITTDDVKYFAKLWSMEYPWQENTNFNVVMNNVQGDTYIRKFAEALNPHLRGEK